MRKINLRILTTAIIVVLAYGVSFAQSGETVMKFAPGKSAATVSRLLAADELHTYSLRVKKGQKIIVKVRSGNGKVDLDTSNFTGGHFEEAGHKSLSLTVDQTGDYQVYVKNTGAAATRFVLTVAVR